MGTEALKVAPIDFQSIQTKALHSGLTAFLQTNTCHSMHPCVLGILLYSAVIAVVTAGKQLLSWQS